MKTPPTYPQVTAAEMRDRYLMQQSAIDGTLHIRSLDDEHVLAAARDADSDSHRAIHAHMGAEWNLSWIKARCAEEAYERGLIGEREFDFLSE